VSDEVGGVRLVHHREGPARQVWRRVLVALALLVLTVVVVYLGRGGYQDNNGGPLSLLDATYYATVSLSTTGYGDIVPVSPLARLVNIGVVTPLRIIFLIVLIGTTLEALTARSREEFRIRRWRSSVRQHVVVCGYGTKGRSAIRALLGNGCTRADVVVVDADPRAVADANEAGYTAVLGDASRTEVLRRAEVGRARAVLVATSRDDAAVLIVLTVRQLNPTAPVTASVREEENASLLRQSGADSVIVSSATSGRLLGLSTDSPGVVSVVEDLLTTGHGLDLAERVVTAEEVGLSPRQLQDVVLSVTRGGRQLRFDDARLGTLESRDVLVVVRGRPGRDAAPGEGPVRRL